MTHIIRKRDFNGLSYEARIRCRMIFWQNRDKRTPLPKLFDMYQIDSKVYDTWQKIKREQDKVETKLEKRRKAKKRN